MPSPSVSARQGLVPIARSVASPSRSSSRSVSARLGIASPSQSRAVARSARRLGAISGAIVGGEVRAEALGEDAQAKARRLRDAVLACEHRYQIGRHDDAQARRRGAAGAREHGPAPPVAREGGGVDGAALAETGGPPDGGLTEGGPVRGD